MTEIDYWSDFWTKGSILEQTHPQLRVGRSKGGQPIDEGLWQATLGNLEKQLELKAEDSLLDIAAGSGVISIPFSKKVTSVVALDISKELLDPYSGIDNITTKTGDANHVEYETETFSKVVLYFALQHFDEGQCVALFKKIFKWLKPEGIFFCGDIPDVSRKFEFFNNPERRKVYFEAVKNQKPIIGSWYHKTFLEELGREIGFQSVVVMDQPKAFYNAHYRFDLILKK